uniref:Uncharacterized protein n=1 Tax=Setaria digitata TaxID=48799 RepID=A0A915PKZ5_9BILA
MQTKRVRVICFEERLSDCCDCDWTLRLKGRSVVTCASCVFVVDWGQVKLLRSKNMVVQFLKNEEEFNHFIRTAEYSLVHFSAKWSKMCDQLNDLLLELKDEMKCFDFAALEAEEVAEISVAYKITAAPTVLFFKKGEEVDRLQGFDPGELKTKIIKHNFVEGVASMTGKPTGDEKNASWFSGQIVNILREVNADFSSFDILEDDEVGQKLKEYSSWPTYPQLYLNGELIGGLDILREELNNPDFCAKLPKRKDINERLKALINQAPLMLFMKGSPETPQCKFSKKMIELLAGINATYSFFDILGDDEVRQGLKEYSNWPTYPQLYLNGELIGGLDVVAEELENPDFVVKLPRHNW